MLQKYAKFSVYCFFYEHKHTGRFPNLHQCLKDSIKERFGTNFGCGVSKYLNN